MPSEKSRFPHVLILGAGLGGLALAQALRKQGVSFEVFERDESLTSRSQGWSILLHWILQDLVDSMPNDLPPIDVTSHLLPLKLPAQMFMFRGKEKQLYFESTDEAKVIRANRPRLRKWLSTNIPVGWNHTMTRIQEDDTSVTLHFADGTSAVGDVLVGADGVQSPVRHHLLGSLPLKTVPMAIVVGQITVTKEQYERQMKLSHSCYSVTGDEFLLFVGLNSVSEDASVADYYWFLFYDDARAEFEPQWTASASTQDQYAFAVEKTKSLDPELQEIIRLTKPEGIVTPPIVIRDMILENMPNRRVTLLGDAAHPMTPFRGEGGNHAIKDALNLARALAKTEPTTIQATLKEYQDEMLARGGEAVRKSRAARLPGGPLR